MQLTKGEKRPRRPHRKSRLGCAECKRRKIKCDETRPACLNCLKRNVLCSSPSVAVNTLDLAEACSSFASRNPYHDGIRFVSTAYSPSETSSNSTSANENSLATSNQNQALHERLQRVEDQLHFLLSREESPKLSYSDMALLYHYTNSTSTTFAASDNAGSIQFWRHLPELGNQHHHILHLLLSFSALHQAHLQPSNKAELRAQADYHHAIGMRGATYTLQNFADIECDVAYASTVLITLINFAFGPRQGEYVGFNSGEGTSLLTLIRGVRAIREIQTPATDSPEANADQAMPDQSSYFLGFETPIHEHQSTWRAHVQDLRAHLMTRTISEDGNLAEIYLQTLTALEPFLATALEDDCNDSADPYTQFAFAWVYRLSDSFVEELQQKKPLALALFACWAVVLGTLEAAWLVNDWPEHIISGTWEHLPPEDRHLIHWPMAQIGWSPRSK